MTVVALVPAHNEEEAIARTIKSLQMQTHPLDVIIVLADNCTDNTVQIAVSMGAKVLETIGNTDKKAGALNQGLAYCLANYPDVEFILQMDADTELTDRFVERTLRVMEHRADIGGLCSSYIGKDKKADTLVGRFLVWGQRVEFIRYQAGQVTLQVSVLSGTATLFRVKALKDILKNFGDVWNRKYIVEDYCTTKMLQMLGWKAMTHSSFLVHTDVMTDWKSLLKQRIRWQLGTLNVVFRAPEFKNEKLLKREAWRQRYVYLMFFPHILGYGFLSATLALLGFHWIMLAGFMSVALYEAWPARKLGFWSYFLTLMLVPVEVYNFLRYVWMWKSWRLYRKKVPLNEW